MKKPALVSPVAASAPLPQAGSEGQGTRMLIYSHDTFGLGHLQRCLNLSRALVERYPAMAILLVTGSPVVHRFRLPPGVDYVKLPAVRKVGPEEYEARSLATSYTRTLKLRTSILLQTVKEYQPHMLLVDHSPLGMKGEMQPALEWLSRADSGCVTMLGLRDIIDDPQTVIDHWQDQGIYDVLQNCYDRIVVYGTRSFFDPVAAYRFPAGLEAKTEFCNYVTDPADDGDRPTMVTNQSDRKLVLVTIGGGDGGGETVIRPYLEWLQKLSPAIDFDTTVITGPFLSDVEFQELKDLARGLPVALRRFVASMAPLVRRSNLVIATGGYNTVTQLLTLAGKALIIPRVMHRQEQLLRSQRLAEMGIVSFIHPDQASPDRIGDEVRTILANERRPVAEARANGLIRFDGASRLAATCQPYLADDRQPEEIPYD